MKKIIAVTVSLLVAFTTGLYFSQLTEAGERAKVLEETEGFFRKCEKEHEQLQTAIRLLVEKRVQEKLNEQRERIEK